MKVHFIHTTKTPTADALIDTGATHNFLSPTFVKNHHLKLTPLNQPRIIRNVDGTSNKGGKITHFIDLDVTLGTQPQHWFHKHKKTLRFYVADLGQDHIILGFPWMVAIVTFPLWTGPDCVLTGYDYGPNLTISHGLLPSSVISHVR